MSIRINGKKQKRNALASVQKNLKIMEDQAKQFINKHNANLPPICTARHYLYHSLKKPQKKQTQQEVNSNFIAKPINNKLTNNKSFLLKNVETNNHTTVYNVQFKNYVSLNFQQLNGKSLMNATSMRMKMNQQWKSSKKNMSYSNENQQKQKSSESKSKEKFTNIIMNAQTIEVDSKNKINMNFNKMFAPRMSRTDLSKNSTDILQKYYTRYVDPKFNNKKIKQRKNKELSELVKYITISTDKKIQQKELIQTRKIQTRKKEHNTIENPQKIRTRAVIIKNSDKEVTVNGKKFQRKSDARQKKKQHTPYYSPWQNNNGQEFYDLIGIDKF